jgi:hypothetical protein
MTGVEAPDDLVICGKCTVALPPGMTQEEADRLVAEADAAHERKD